jgi:MATE family multidrug resistance protein
MVSTLAAAVLAGVVLVLTATLGWGLAGVWWGITTLILGRLVLLAFRYRGLLVGSRPST